jgi:hypothetical protein
MHRCIDAETRAMGNDRSGKGMNDGMDGKRMNEYAVDRSINERDRGIKRFKGGRKTGIIHPSHPSHLISSSSCS